MKQTKYTEREVDAAYDKGILEGKRLAHKAIKAAYGEGVATGALESINGRYESINSLWRQSTAKKELGE